jgi:hypothetical protein
MDLLRKSRAIIFMFSLCAVLSFNTLFAQNATVDHWETVVYADDMWRYFRGVSEPDANWKKLSFDDSGWAQGPGGIGYGDGDDNTIIEPCTSLYLRIKFNIYDVSKIASAILHVDYDDSFVAYLNEIEIARAGVSGNPPAFDQTADANHEAQMYQGGLPEAFTIDPITLAKALQPNDNVLAIQVHNVDATSSDMSSIVFFSVAITDTSRSYRQIPGWFRPAFQFSSSDIPIMVIDTEGRHIVDEPKTMARMGIIYNGEGQRNYLTDPFNEYDGWIGIEYRGNASMGFDKKPFTFETRNEAGADTNVSLLGMPKENDYILRAAFIDKTLMRDAIAYDMSRKIGRWAPRTRHVELVLNGSYEGVYVLVEKIKPDKNRLNIVRMDSSDIAGEALTGGYIWSVQQSDNNDVVFLRDHVDGNSRILKYPKPDEVRPEQIEYIRQYEESFRNVMYGPNYNDPVNGYLHYIDPSTFVDEIIVQEATSNSDAYGWSSYFYKDRNGLMSAGPVWDFDQALCNSTYNEGDRTDAFVIEKTVDWGRPSYWDRLWADSDFKNQVKQKWTEYRQGPLKDERIFAFIDSVGSYLNEAQEHNFTRWPILGKYVWRTIPGYEDRDTYQKEVDFMKTWLTAHLHWMDLQLTSIPPDTGGVVNEEGLVAYYKFDEGAGVVVTDHSGNELHGQIVGSPQWTEGHAGGALLFNGNDSYVDCGNDPRFNITKEISLMAWVKPFDIGDGQHNPWITKGDHSWALKEYQDGQCEFFVYDSGWLSVRKDLDASYNDQWHHYAGVYDGAQLRLFFDGNLESIVDHAGSIESSDYAVHLAHNAEVSDRFFNGLLDEVRIYNIALSDEQIKAVYNGLDTSASEQDALADGSFVLRQNYPNPFNPETTISYALPASEVVTLKIYDLLGKEIRTLVHEQQTAGLHTVCFNADGLASGVYFYKLQAGDIFQQVKKMLLLR